MFIIIMHKCCEILIVLKFTPQFDNVYTYIDNVSFISLYYLRVVLIIERYNNMVQQYCKSLHFTYPRAA